jgi:hypothetical protein
MFFEIMVIQTIILCSIYGKLKIAFSAELAQNELFLRNQYERSFPFPGGGEDDMNREFLRVVVIVLASVVLINGGADFSQSAEQKKTLAARR